MTFFTDAGKPVLLPEGRAFRDAHAGSAPSPHETQEPSPRVFCHYCLWDEPGDLAMDFSYLERRFVWACADWTWCEFRAVAG